VQTCSNCHALSPDEATNCVQCGYDLSQWSNAAVALKRFQDNARVLYVRISVAHDACPACREAEGAYAKDSIPRLPIEGCSHHQGCRCFYQPVLDEVYP